MKQCPKCGSPYGGSKKPEERDRIEIEKYTYTYRSYMACEDQREDDCVGTEHKYVVYRGNRKLKEHHSIENAEAHVRRLKKKNLR